jgi:hypothetical protein
MVFALFERVPALRSVIAYLRSNPSINATERHRIENEALDRRHEREHRSLDRRESALDKIDARERRGLVRDLVRQTRVDDIQRQSQTEQREREARETADDITVARHDDGQCDTADERRVRMQERLAQARQKPSGPRRGQPGWE